MKPDTFKKTTAREIRDVLRDQSTGLGSYFKRFLIGPVNTVKISTTPCLVVENNITHIDQGTTATDEENKKITIKIIIDARDEIGVDDDVVPGAETLELLVEGKDPDTGEYDSRSVMGILRKNLTLNQTLVNQSIDIQYFGSNFTDGRTIEAHITFNCISVVKVTGRT